MSSREFNQNSTRAKSAAKDGPVFITDRGTPTHVLLTIEDYQRLAGRGKTLLEAVAQYGPEADFDFDPPRSRSLPRDPPDFSD